MGALDREGFLQNFDKMMNSDVWRDLSLPENARSVKSNEKAVTQRLGKIANDYFQQSSSTLKGKRSPLKGGESLDAISRFLSLGQKRGWLTADKIEKFHRLATSAGVMGKSSKRESSPRGRPDDLGKIFQEISQNTATGKGNRDRSPKREPSKTKDVARVDRSEEAPHQNEPHKPVNAFHAIVQSKFSNFRSMQGNLFEKVYQAMIPVEGATLKTISKEAVKRIHLAHIVESEDIGKFSDRRLPMIPIRSYNYAGCFAEYQFTKISKSLFELSEMLPGIIPGELANLIGDTVNLCLDYPQSSEQLYQRWVDGLPILINSGYAEHYTSMLVWQDKFILINRGEACFTDDDDNMLSAVSATFNADPHIFTPEIINHIQAIYQTGTEESFIKLVSDELPTWLGFKITELDKFIEMAKFPMQIVGNCTWANAEAGVFYLMLMYHLYEHRRKNSPIDGIRRNEAVKIVDQQINAFQNVQAYFLIRAMKKYADWVKNPNNKFVPDFNLLEQAFNSEIYYKKIHPDLRKLWQNVKTEWDDIKLMMQDASFLKLHYHFGVHLSKFKFW